MSETKFGSNPGFSVGNIHIHIYIILSCSGISFVPVILNLTLSQILKKKIHKKEA